jgi:hypothetical protein
MCVSRRVCCVVVVLCRVDGCACNVTEPACPGLSKLVVMSSCAFIARLHASLVGQPFTCSCAMRLQDY